MQTIPLRLEGKSLSPLMSDFMYVPDRNEVPFLRVRPLSFIVITPSAYDPSPSPSSKSASHRLALLCLSSLACIPRLAGYGHEKREFLWFS